MQEHWERVYGAKTPDQLSWFRPHLETSLAMIEQATKGNLAATIIDVGGGASTLVDDLLNRGFSAITVVDISQQALDLASKRLGHLGNSVEWVRADITRSTLPHQSLDVWHDRAVFHFLTSPEDRAAYVRCVLSAVKPGGHVIVGTFGPEGPSKCSGLDVVRYDAEHLHDQFGSMFHLVESRRELHQTPLGAEQQFVYCYCTLKSV